MILEYLMTKMAVCCVFKNDITHDTIAKEGSTGATKCRKMFESRGKEKQAKVYKALSTMTMTVNSSIDKIVGSTGLNVDSFYVLLVRYY